MFLKKLKPTTSSTLIFICLLFTSALCAKSNESSVCLNTTKDASVLDHCLRAYKNPDTQESPEQMVAIGLKIAELHQDQQHYEKSNQVLLSIEQQYSDNSHQFSTRHRLLRLKGMNFYYMRAYSQSLETFKQAFNIAQVQNDLLALSISYNDLGVVYKAQSRFADSLSSYTQSLRIKETLGVDLEIAKSLNNIANVYLLMDKFESAITFHKRALVLFEKFAPKDFASKEQLVHIKDQIARALSRLGDSSQAIQILEESITHVSESSDSGLLLFETRCNLALIYLQNGQINQALETIDLTQNITGISPDQKLFRHEVYTTIFMQQTDFSKAEKKALNGLNLALDNKSHESISLFYRLLSEIKHAQGQDTAALNYLKQFIESHENNLKQTYDTGVKYLQNEIELQVQQKNISLLQKNNQIQELQIKKQRLVVFSVLLMAIFSALMVWWFIKKKASEKRQLLKQIDYHRNQLNVLKAPKHHLENFLKEVTEPVVCVDQNYLITYMNEAFCEFFGIKRTDLTEVKLTTFLPVLESSINAITFNKDDLPQQQFMGINLSDDRQVVMWISVILNMDNSIALSFQVNQTNPATPTECHHMIENSNQVNSIMSKLNTLKDNNSVLTQEIISQIEQKLKLADSSEDNLGLAYRNSMVDLMTSNLEVWRINTQGDRISLAEESSVWKVTIDDGRLRTRAMDRYFNMKTLPKTPRWRSVVKTSHFILAECNLTFDQRNHLNKRLEVFMMNLKALTTGI